MFMELKEVMGGTTDDVMKFLFGWSPRLHLKPPDLPGDEYPIHYVRVSVSVGKRHTWFDTAVGKSIALVKWFGRGKQWNLTLRSMYGTGRLRAVEFNGELYVVDSRLLIPPLRPEAYTKYADWMVRRLLVMADNLCSRLSCKEVLVEPDFLNQYPVMDLFKWRTGVEKN